MHIHTYISLYISEYVHKFIYTGWFHKCAYIHILVLSNSNTTLWKPNPTAGADFEHTLTIISTYTYLYTTVRICIVNS